MRRHKSAASIAQAIKTRRPKGAAWEAVRDIPGMTYRQFDYWCTRGYIRFDIERDKTENGSGNWRTLTEDEIRVVTLMTELVTLGMSPQTAEPLARTLALGITATFGGFKIRCAA